MLELRGRSFAGVLHEQAHRGRRSLRGKRFGRTEFVEPIGAEEEALGYGLDASRRESGGDLLVTVQCSSHDARGLAKLLGILDVVGRAEADGHHGVDAERLGGGNGRDIPVCAAGTDRDERVADGRRLRVVEESVADEQGGRRVGVRFRGVLGFRTLG